MKLAELFLPDSVPGNLKLSQEVVSFSIEITKKCK